MSESKDVVNVSEREWCKYRIKAVMRCTHWPSNLYSRRFSPTSCDVITSYLPHRRLLRRQSNAKRRYVTARCCTGRKFEPVAAEPLGVRFSNRHMSKYLTAQTVVVEAEFHERREVTEHGRDWTCSKMA